jgi:photosystem II stability/assembly factor-like uncharacterized protein
MKAKIFLSTLLLIPLISLGQANWNEVMSYIGNGRYDDLFFLNENLGWAAGSGGYVLKTEDGGQNWNGLFHLEDVYFRNIEFLNENIGFLGTLDGGFYRTVDGGINWNLVEDIVPPDPNFPSEPNEVFCGLSAVGTTTIFGCGTYFGPAYIIKSTDSGETWQYIDMSSYAESLVEVLFIDENIGFASGGNSNGGIILKTDDGGNSWNEIYHTGINGEWVWKLQRLFSNPDVMFGSVESIAPLNGKLIKSIDGGVNWISKEVPDTDIQAVGFISESHGWMGGHHTGFLETFDAGDTWIDTGIGGNLNRIQVFNENLVYCSGQAIYKYSDENLGILSYNAAAERDRLKVKISPNPIENQLEFTVDFKSADHIILRLFDVNGKMLQEFKTEKIPSAISKKYSFPFPYPSGTYFLNLHNDSGGQSEKFIKK